MCILIGTRVRIFTTMSLSRWLVLRDESCSSDNKALMAGTKAVEAVQKEREELERNGRKRQSSERHHYKQKTTQLLESMLNYTVTSEQFQSFLSHWALLCLRLLFAISREKSVSK